VQFRFESQSFVVTGAVSKWRVLRPGDQNGTAVPVMRQISDEAVLFEAVPEI
jgi:hypothetical protein